MLDKFKDFILVGDFKQCKTDDEIVDKVISCLNEDELSEEYKISTVLKSLDNESIYQVLFGNIHRFNNTVQINILEKQMKVPKTNEVAFIEGHFHFDYDYQILIGYKKVGSLEVSNFEINESDKIYKINIQTIKKT